jgi:hypothetical protein
MTESEPTGPAAHFTEPRPNLIESDTGFSVEVLGRTGLRYVEYGRTAIIDSEVLAKPGAIAVYRDSLKQWESPDDQLVLLESDRDRIMANIKQAFTSLGYEAQVIADWTAGGG